MKNFKTLAIAFAIMVGGSTFANSVPGKNSSKSDTSELKELLRDRNLILNGDLFTKVVFTVDSEKNIVVNSILTRDENVRDYIFKKLDDQHLAGKNWEVGRTYILPVRMKGI